MPLLGQNCLGDTLYWCFVATIEKNDRKSGFSEPFRHEMTIRISFLYKSYVLKGIKNMSRSCRDIWGLSNAVICRHCLRKDVFKNVSHIFRNDRWKRTRADHGLHARANVNLKRLACAAWKKAHLFVSHQLPCFVVIRSFNHSNNNVVVE